MRAKPLKKNPNDTGYIQCEPKEATHLEFNFPLKYPLTHRMIPVQIGGTRANTKNWSWDGDIEKPTVKPSVLTRIQWGEEKKELRCHSWVNDGMVQFLDDCSHEFAGQTLDLLEVSKDD